MFGKSNKPSPIDSLIGTGTTIEGDISFTGGLRIDGHVKGNVKATGNKPGTLVVSELAKEINRALWWSRSLQKWRATSMLPM
jgi:cytoskeletal protein CcmA (bactofilin family)